jgi:hypothetical protein
MSHLLPLHLNSSSLLPPLHKPLHLLLLQLIIRIHAALLLSQLLGHLHLLLLQLQSSNMILTVRSAW